MRRLARSILICGLYGFLAFSRVSLQGQAMTDEKAAPKASTSSNFSVDEEKIQLDRERLDFESEKFSKEMSLKASEARTEWLKALISGIAIAVPITLAVIGIWHESKNRRDDAKRELESRQANEKLQFQLKAAEIALNAPDAGQVKQKAEALMQMFPERLPEGWAKNLTPAKFWFGPGRESRLELLKILAECPSQRASILKIWSYLFPGDKTGWKEPVGGYYWLEEILKDTSLNRDSPELGK